MSHDDPVKTITIAAAACCEGRVAMLALMGEARHAEIIRVRHAAMLVARRLRPDLSLPQIGRAFGRRDHTTVINAIKRATAREAADGDFAVFVAEITRRAMAGDVVPPAPSRLPVPAPRPPMTLAERMAACGLRRASHRWDDPDETRRLRTEGQHGTDRMLARLVMLQDDRMEAAE